MSQNNPLGMEHDIRLTAQIALSAIGVGFLFVWAQEYFQGSKDVGGKIFFASLWSLACLAAGGLIGFLFGIPRWLQTDAPAAPAAGTQPGSDTAANGANNPQVLDTRGGRSRVYSPNTNLDRISDWLTTILVGVGLVELQTIATQFDRATALIGQGLGDEPNKSLAGAIIIYFSVVGFLGVYLMTRLYLSQVIKGVEDLLGIDPDLKDALLRSDLSNPMNPDLGPEPGSDIKRILSVPLDSLSDPTAIVIWSKSQFRAQNYSNAAAGYKKAIALNPNDIQLRLEYANVLFYASRGPSGESSDLRSEREGQLLAAYRLLDDSTDAEARMKVYRALTFFYLYDQPPAGFETVIRYGSEFLSSPAKKMPSGGLLVNLAAAYGQKCAWLEKNSPNDVAGFCENRNESFKACAAALEMNKVRWGERLRTLLQTDIEKDRDDTDLEVFEHDNKFRTLLDLPTVPADQDTGTKCD